MLKNKDTQTYTYKCIEKEVEIPPTFGQNVKAAIENTLLGVIFVPIIALLPILFILERLKI